MVAPLRLFLLALVALAACTPVIAEVQCFPNGDGSWTCSGYGSGSQIEYVTNEVIRVKTEVVYETRVVTNWVYSPTPPEPGDEPVPRPEVITNYYPVTQVVTSYYPVASGVVVVTNMLGACTNCVAMTPDICEDLKGYLEVQIDSIEPVLLRDSSILQESLGSIEDILYGPLDYLNTLEDDFTGSTDGSDYISDSLQDMQGKLETLSHDVSSVSDDIQSLRSKVLNRINCSSCTASYDSPIVQPPPTYPTYPDNPSSPSSPSTPPSSGGSSDDCPCKEQLESLLAVVRDDILPKVKSLDDNVKAFKTKLLDTQKYLDELKYVTVGFSTNSVPEETKFDTESGDWFDVVLASIRRNNELNASTTYLLKRILDNLKTDEIKGDLDSIQNSADDIKARLESLTAEFESKFGEEKFKFADVEDNFAFGDSVFAKFPKSTALPSKITFSIPEISMFNSHYGNWGQVEIDTTSIVPFLDLCRSVFSCFYWCCLAFFILVFFRFFYAFLIRFVKVLANILQW